MASNNDAAFTMGSTETGGAAFGGAMPIGVSVAGSRELRVVGRRSGAVHSA